MCGAKFYICKHCGNIIEILNSSGVSVVCCGEKMQELIPGTVDASLEKHVPVVTVDGDTVTVKVGSVAHPMIPEHYIQWIYLKTDKATHRRCLNPGEEPEAVFTLNGEKPVSAYEYCNLHGLWKTDI